MTLDDIIKNNKKSGSTNSRGRSNRAPGPGPSRRIPNRSANRAAPYTAAKVSSLFRLIRFFFFVFSNLFPLADSDGAATCLTVFFLIFRHRRRRGSMTCMQISPRTWQQRIQVVKVVERLPSKREPSSTYLIWITVFPVTISRCDL